MSRDTERRFCSTGSHWTAQEFRKVGSRWICLSCYERRKRELRKLPRNKKLARGGS